MVHSEVVGEGDGLQIWRMAVNTLNKQLWTANNGVLQLGSWVVGKLLIITTYMVQNVLLTLGLGWIIWNGTHVLDWFGSG